MSVSSMTPLTRAACGPIAAIRASVPVCCLAQGRRVGTSQAARGAVRDPHQLAVLGLEVLRVAGRAARSIGVLGHDLARVAMVGGDHDQRVRVRALPVERGADGPIEGNVLADLLARVGGKARYDQALDGSTQTVTQYAQAQKGYRFVANASELSAVKDLKRRAVVTAR
jgi:hypothetical protein